MAFQLHLHLAAAIFHGLGVNLHQAGDILQNAPDIFLLGLHHQIDRGGAGKEPFQVFRTVAGHQFAFGDDEDGLTYGLYFRQNVAGKNHRMVFSQLLDQFPDLRNLSGVQSYGGLIQNDDLRISQNGLCNANPLFVAFGQVFNQPVGNVLNLSDRHNVGELIGNVGLPDALGTGNKSQILPRGPVQIQRRLLWEIANQLFCLLSIFENVKTANANLTGRGGQTSGHDVHGCGFSCAVWPQKPINLPFFNVKGQIPYGGMIAISLAQMVYFNQDNSSFSAGNHCSCPG